LDSDDNTGVHIYAAKAAGHKFIEVHLSPDANIQGAGRISGAYTLDVFPGVPDRNNLPTFEFNVRGGDIQFAFDKEKYAMVAQVLDDDKPGVVSKVGYNRDFLASHLGMFIIPDKEIAEDVAKRAELIQDKADADAVEAEPDMELYAPEAEETVSDIDKKMQALSEKRALMTGQPLKGTTPPKKRGRKPMTVEQRKAVAERFAAGKAKKKAEREATGSTEDAPPVESKEDTVAQHETNSEVAPA